jgi:hypothetical protein
MSAHEHKEPHEVSFETPRYIRCPDCGEQIMMVPVLSQMIEAIENHISTHQVNIEKPKPDLEIKPPELREDLTVQVLQRAAEIGGALSRNPTWTNTE